jgi:hypothetical protein
MPKKLVHFMRNRFYFFNFKKELVALGSYSPGWTVTSRSQNGPARLTSLFQKRIKSSSQEN